MSNSRYFAEYLPPPGETTDAATIYVDLQVYVTEEYPVVPFDLQVLSTEAAQFIDAATIYLDLTLTGGECYSSSSGLNLEAEAYLRWLANAQQRWLAEEELRWISGDPFTQFIVEDAFPQWVVIGISTDQGC